MKAKPTFHKAAILPRIPLDASQVVLTAYVTAIALVEIIGVFGPIMVSIVGYALLVPILLNHYLFHQRAPYRRLLPALALIPLLRLVSLAIPLRDLPELYWYLMVGLPMLSAAFLTVRLLGLSPDTLGLRMNAWWWQVIIALSGLPLGLAAFLLFRPRPLIENYNLSTMLVGAVILTIFDGFVEEFIFRGVLQGLASELLGVAGLVLANGLFTLLYLGNLSGGYLLFIGLTGFYFGWSARRTGSIWGVVLAHSWLKIGLLLLWPLLWD